MGIQWMFMLSSRQYIYKHLSNNNEIIKNQSSKFNGQFAEPGSRYGVRTAKSSEVPGATWARHSQSPRAPRSGSGGHMDMMLLLACPKVGGSHRRERCRSEDGWVVPTAYAVGQHRAAATGWAGDRQIEWKVGQHQYGRSTPWVDHSCLRRDGQRVGRKVDVTWDVVHVHWRKWQRLRHDRGGGDSGCPSPFSWGEQCHCVHRCNTIGLSLFCTAHCLCQTLNLVREQLCQSSNLANKELKFMLSLSRHLWLNIIIQEICSSSYIYSFSNTSIYGGKWVWYYKVRSLFEIYFYFFEALYDTFEVEFFRASFYTISQTFKACRAMQLRF